MPFPYFGLQPQSEARAVQLDAECQYQQRTAGRSRDRCPQSQLSNPSIPTTQAKQRLAEMRPKFERLGKGSEFASIAFQDRAKPWLKDQRSQLKTSSIRRRDLSVKQLVAQLGTSVVRNITRRSCDKWANLRSKNTSGV